jgi:glycosyltransferase involved in cell wall biosynthesis
MIRRPHRTRGDATRDEASRGAAKPVAVITTTIPITVDKFHREIIRQVQAQGYDVCVISSPGPELDRVGADMGVRVRSVPMTREISPLADLVALVCWVAVCLSERPALMISATPKASLLSLVAARGTRVPRRIYCLIGLRLEGDRGLRRQLLALMERLTSWASTEVVANSPSLAARYAQLGLAPRRKLRETRPGSDHGVDGVHYSPRPADANLADALGIDRSVPVLGLVGRLTHDKGVDTLIEAMALLQADSISCQLLVVGPQNEPDSAAYLKALSSMGGHVVAVGAVEDIRPYFALMDLHVLPSLREGFPNVVLEASAMGLPTVTTDATGAIDSVKHGVTGLMVRTQDPRELADAITTVLGDPALAAKLGAEARRWVVADFRPDTVVRSLLAFGEGAANGAGNTRPTAQPTGQPTAQPTARPTRHPGQSSRLRR